jgi:hypothetical protein
MLSPSPSLPLTGGSPGAGGPRATRFRLASPSTALVLVGVTVMLVAALTVLSQLTHDLKTT